MFRYIVISALLVLMLVIVACVPVDPANTGVATPSGSDAGDPSEPVTSSDQPQLEGGAPPSPFDPIPGEDKMIRSSLAIQASSLVIMESYPLQITVHLEGSLPTPCHHLRAKVQGPDAENRIDLEVYTLVDPEVVCIQVVAPYIVNLNLGSFPDGSYSVSVNGQTVGEFTQ